MPPMPPGPNAAEILQGLWEESLEPADLTRRSLELKELSRQLVATAEDGLAKTQYLLRNHGQGVLAEAICQAWTDYWVKVAIVSAQVLQSSACLDAWATTLGSMLFNMTGVVESAEAIIKMLEGARPLLEFFNIDVDAEIQAIKEQAQEDVRALSAAAMGALAAVPSWAGQVPAGMPMPGGGGMSSSTAGPTPQGEQQSSTTSASNSTAGTTPEGGSPTTTQSASSSTQGPTPGSGTAPEAQPSIHPASNSTTGPSPHGGTPTTLGSPAASSSTSAPGGAGVGGGSSSLAPGSAPSSGTGSGGTAGTTNTPAPAGSPAPSSAGSAPAASTPASGAPSPPSSTTPTQSAAPESMSPAAASSGPAGTAPQATAGSSAAGIAPMSGVVSSAAAVGGSPSSALPPVSAAASPIASAAAGAVPAPPPVPPPTPAAPLSPVSPGSSLAPPPSAAAVPPPPAPGVHASAAPGPGPTASTSPPPPPPQTAHPGSSASTSATPPPNAAASPSQSTQQGQPDSPSTADRGGAANPVMPLSSVHDPLIAPAAFVTPPIVFAPAPDHEDLAAVRITLEAVGGGDHVQWAAGMVAVSGGKHLVVTSDRGRGWMPPNAVLPASIEQPWNRSEAAQWEGVLDPARVIVEYTAAVGGVLTALASTNFSPPSVVAQVPFVYVDATERAHPELLTSPILRGPTATRFDLQISPGLRKSASRYITEPEQRQQALACAYAAHLDAETLSEGVWHSDVRPRLYAVLQDRQTVAPTRITEVRPLLDELKNEWLTLRDSEHAARVDVRDVAVGQLDNSGGAGLPYLVQGYATEAALGLFNSSAPGAFSCALYHWARLRDYVADSSAVAS